jgi:hypothetical protein
LIPYVLAVFACCLAGAQGGFALARPHEALALRGLLTIDAAPGGLAAARGFGAMMLLGHAGTAGLLGYSPGVGAAMALALGLLWGGSALGRVVSSVLDRQVDARGVQLVLLEAMLGLTLSLPFWSSRQLTAGPVFNV